MFIGSTLLRIWLIVAYNGLWCFCNLVCCWVISVFVEGGDSGGLGEGILLHCILCYFSIVCRMVLLFSAI